MAIPVEKVGNKVGVCSVCGAKIVLNKPYHYIARDDGAKGLVAVLSKEQEETLYDAFDCPMCGCQYIAQERKRTLFVACSDEPSDDNTETSDKIEVTSDKDENPECKGCEYDGDQPGIPFSMVCVNCRRMYTDKYIKKQ